MQQVTYAQRSSFGSSACTFRHTDTSACLSTCSCSPIRLGRSGIEEFLPLGAMNDLEQRNYDTMLPELAGSIKKGIEFVQRRAEKQ